MGTDANGHVNEEELERYSLQANTEAECARLEEHILLCQACRQRVAENDVFIAAMRLAGRYLRAEPVARKATFWTMARMAPVLGAVAVFGALAFFLPGIALRPAMPLSPLNVDLATARGTLQAKAPAGRALVLKFDLTGLPSLPSYRLEVVDSAGTPVRRTQTRTSADVSGLSPGVYFVRLYTPSGELLREYGLQVERP